MNPYAILAAIVIAISIGAGGYIKGRADEKAVSIERERDSLLAYAERIKTSQEELNANANTIDNLRTELSRRVRITIPVCKSEDQGGTSGLLSVRVSQAFAEFRTEVEGLLYRCDQLNNEAIRANHASSQ